MSPTARVAVVVPAYRATETIGSVVASIPDWVVRIIVVDDASDDELSSVVAALLDPRVVLVRHDENGGVGQAMKTGYKVALADDVDIIVKMDGDGQMRATDLPALLLPLIRGVADYSKGNRFRYSSELLAMPRARRFGNLALSFLAKWASGYWNIFDPTNGYTAIRRDMLSRIDLGRLSNRYFFEISMLVELNLHQAVVHDVLLPARYGNEESSMHLPTIALTFPQKLMVASLRRFFMKHFFFDFTATALFALFGLPLILLGSVVGARFWLGSILSGVPTTAGQVMLAGLPLLVGIHLLVQALVFDMTSTPSSASHAPLVPPFSPPSDEATR